MKSILSTLFPIYLVVAPTGGLQLVEKIANQPHSEIIDDTTDYDIDNEHINEYPWPKRNRKQNQQVDNGSRLLLESTAKSRRDIKRDRKRDRKADKKKMMMGNKKSNNRGPVFGSGCQRFKYNASIKDMANNTQGTDTGIEYVNTDLYAGSTKVGKLFYRYA